MEADAVHESDFLVTMTEAKLLRGKRGFEIATSLHARQLAFPHTELQNILTDKDSPKEIESGALYAWKKDTKTPWQFIWLPVVMTQGEYTKFEVCWERAMRYVLVEDKDKNMAPQGRRMVRNNLSLVDTSRPETTASFPQFNKFDVLEQIMCDMGKLGGRNIIDDLPTNTARKWRSGDFFALNKRQKGQVEPSDVNDLMDKFDYKFERQTRSRSYLINALDWLGMVEDYCPVTNTIVPSDLCIMLAYVDNDIRVQRLWNILMCSDVMQTIAKGEEPAEILREKEGLLNEETFKRRASTAKAWTKTLKAWMQAAKGVTYVNIPA